MANHTNLTVTCKVCQKDFTAPYDQKDQVYCSQACQSAQALTSKCIVCSENFSHHGERVVCGTDCLNKYVSELRLCAFGPMRKRMSLNKEVCLLCGSETSGYIHHVDYDESNCDPENLILLCNYCYVQTNRDCFFWQAAITAILSGSKIVKKGWGFEVHITNTPEYCLKYLVFFAGKKFSLHYHEDKKELWHCLAGKFICRLQQDYKVETFDFTAGNKIEVTPGLIHQLTALKNSVLIEVSTRDFPEDSIRISKGD